MPAPSGADFRWLTVLLTLMFQQTNATFKVRASGFGGEAGKDRAHVGGWWVDHCIPVKIQCEGWSKIFRIPISYVKNEDIRACVVAIRNQSDGQIMMQEISIQALESEGQLH